MGQDEEDPERLADFNQAYRLVIYFASYTFTVSRKEDL
jgi:hypothetical protein